MSLQLVRGRYTNVLDIPSNISSLIYKVQIIDNFIDNATVNESISNADISGANRIILYDNETITPVGNNITISSAPNFTVAVGDIIRQGNKVAKITSVVSQTQVVVDSGTGLTASSATISQCIHSVDLNDFTDSFNKTKPKIVYTSNISNAMIQYYDDTEDTNDTTPNIAIQSSINNYTNATNVLVKDGVHNEQELTMSYSPTGASLYVRFFSNITTGQGRVILKGYKISFHTS